MVNYLQKTAYLVSLLLTASCKKTLETKTTMGPLPFSTIIQLMEKGNIPHGYVKPSIRHVDQNISTVIYLYYSLDGPPVPLSKARVRACTHFYLSKDLIFAA